MKVDKAKWCKAALSEICSIQMGQSPDSSSYNTNEEGLPFYQGNADFGPLYPTPRIYCNAPTRIANEGDLLISVRAPIGAINIANSECCIGRGLASIKSKDGLSYIPYLKFLLRAYNKELNNLGTGMTFKAINKKALHGLPILAPKLNEQRGIAAELDAIQAMIDGYREQLADLDRLAQSIFLDTFGDPISNPKGWEITNYEQEFKITSGGTPSKKIPEYWENGTIPWIGSNMCTNSILYETDGKTITQLGLDNSSAKIFPINTIIIALVGATIGKTSLLATPTATNQNVAGLTIKRVDVLTPIYGFYHTRFLYPLFQNIGEGKFTISNQGFIKKLPLCLSPLSLQQQFAEQVEAIERQKEAIRQQLADAETLMAERMQYYFS